MSKVYGYIRVSTATQAEKGYGLETQEKAIQQYCKDNNLELIDIFKDEGVSGTIIERDGLTELLASLKEVDKVIVLNTSRLWREEMVKVLVKREFIKCKVDIISIEQKDYSVFIKDPNDFLLSGIMELLDSYERMTISIKLAKGRRTKAKGGNKPAGIAPIGYKWVNNRIEIDNYQAETVKAIYNGYLNLKSLSKLSSSLESKGYKSNNNKPFSKASLSHILKNEFYIGVITHDTVKVPGQHSPIIDNIIFSQVQALLKQKSTT